LKYKFLIFLLIISTGYSYGKEELNLEFLLRIDKDIYEMSDFGEPPQIVVWIKVDGKKGIKTVGATRRVAMDDWKGKIKCPTALPIWKSLSKSEKYLPDAYTCPTPKDGLFICKTRVNRGKIVECFIELNLSGDFNLSFPYRDDNGMPDPEVNGQPSLIYYCKFKARDGVKKDFKLIGRSEQFNPVEEIIRDLKGLTSAKKILENALVRCIKN